MCREKKKKKKQANSLRCRLFRRRLFFSLLRGQSDVRLDRPRCPSSFTQKDGEEVVSAATSTCLAWHCFEPFWAGFLSFVPKASFTTRHDNGRTSYRTFFHLTHFVVRMGRRNERRHCQLHFPTPPHTGLFRETTSPPSRTNRSMRSSENEAVCQTSRYLCPVVRPMYAAAMW